MTLIVVDDSTTETDLGNGLSVSIFRPALEMLPKINAIGNVVQFRHMRIQMFDNCLQAISTNWSAWTVFYQENKEWRAHPEHPIGATELAVLTRLTAQEEGKDTISGGSPLKTKRPVLKLSELEPKIFFNFIGRVIKAFPRTREDQLHLVLTDYTENKQINATIDDFDTMFRFAGLSVTFWDNQVEVAQGLKVGDTVRIENMHARLYDGSLVAALHGDTRARITVLGGDSAEARGLDKAHDAFIHAKKLASAQEHQQVQLSATSIQFVFYSRAHLSLSRSTYLDLQCPWIPLELLQVGHQGTCHGVLPKGSLRVHPNWVLPS